MKITTHCIYHDEKLRPLMSEVVNEITTYYNNGMPCSPLSFEVLYDGPSSSNFSRHGSLSLASFTTTQFHKYDM